MKELKPILDYKQYHDVIFKKIADYWNMVFWEQLESIFDEPLENSTNDLNEALKYGKIYYEDGKFYSKGKFGSKISRELEKLGARFKGGAYILSIDKMDINTRQMIARVNINNQDKLKKMKTYLDNLPEKTAYLKTVLDFRPEVEKIGKHMDGQFKKSLSPINIIPMDLTPTQMQEIAKNYTNNLDKYVSKWTDEQVVKMREKVQEFLSKGYRASEVQKWLEDEKGISKRKAKFLARQETTLLVGEYTKSRYESAGISQYKWSTIMDGRERPLHYELDSKISGKIYSWDSPPIVDQRTGERGHPKTAYGCRCTAIPVISDNWWKGAQI